MGLLKISLSLVCVLDMIMAQDSPEDYLDVHNVARAAVGVRPLQWNNTVAAYAQGFANNKLNNDCRLVHSGGPYGENFARSSGEMSGTDAVKLWVEEKKFYNSNTNSCALGKMCGHYTQVVWGHSVKLGCAKMRCSNGGTFIACNYDPPGNIMGQRPYESGVCTLINLNIKNHIPL